MSSYSRQQLEKWLKTIDVKCNSVLDVGGSQLSIKKRVKSWEVENYKILDLEQPHECKEKPDIIGDLNEYTFIDPSDKPIFNYFDIVFCIEVSEYWWDPQQALTNINHFLKKGGVLYISFHFIYPIHNPKEQDYLRYTPNGIRKLLKETGFEILEETPRLLETGSYHQMINMEKMKPSKDSNEHNYQGLLIKAKKI